METLKEYLEGWDKPLFENKQKLRERALNKAEERKNIARAEEERMYNDWVNDKKFKYLQNLGNKETFYKALNNIESANDNIIPFLNNQREALNNIEVLKNIKDFLNTLRKIIDIFQFPCYGGSLTDLYNEYWDLRRKVLGYLDVDNKIIYGKVDGLFERVFRIFIENQSYLNSSSKHFDDKILPSRSIASKLEKKYKNFKNTVLRSRITPKTKSKNSLDTLIKKAENNK